MSFERLIWCESCGTKRLLNVHGKCSCCDSDAVDVQIHPLTWNPRLENILQSGLETMREQEQIDAEVDAILRRSQ